MVLRIRRLFPAGSWVLTLIMLRCSCAALLINRLAVAVDTKLLILLSISCKYSHSATAFSWELGASVVNAALLLLY
jgi:hypothetical protein